MLPLLRKNFWDPGLRIHLVLVLGALAFSVADAIYPLPSWAWTYFWEFLLFSGLVIGVGMFSIDQKDDNIPRMVEKTRGQMTLSRWELPMVVSALLFWGYSLSSFLRLFFTRRYAFLIPLMSGLAL